MDPYVIGIDIGTGSTKAIAMNYAGEVMDTAQTPYPTLNQAGTSKIRKSSGRHL